FLSCDIHPFPTRRSSDLFEFASRAEDPFDPLERGHEAQASHLGLGPARAFGAIQIEIEIESLDRKLRHRHLERRIQDHPTRAREDRKSTRLNSSHRTISY